MARLQIQCGGIANGFKLAFLSFDRGVMHGPGAATAHKVILLDAYHNQEPKQPMHYRWEGTDNGGFSELGNLLRGMGQN